MQADVDTDATAVPGYISTGHLPDPGDVTTAVRRAHDRFRTNTDGRNSDVYPALAQVPRDLFGICVVGTSGNVYAAATPITNSRS